MNTQQPIINRSLRQADSAFTLVELMIAMTILILLMVFMAQILTAVSRTWTEGERRVETYQSGRAVLDLIARELAPAVMSSAHQLIQNPFTAAQQSITVPNMAPNSDSLFWQAQVAHQDRTELAEVGYYLTRETPTQADGAYQLKRFYVGQPSSVAKPTDGRFIYNAAYSPTTVQARWIASSSATTFTAAEFESLSSVVSDGIVGFWIRCFDVNGEPIPWFYARSPESSAESNVKFNSAARFQPTIPGTAGTTNPAPWPYTSHETPAATDAAHRLPVSIEISIITVDGRALQRRPNIPPLPAINDPADVPTAIATYLSQDLIGNKVDSARLFTTRVRLDNGSQ